MRRPLNQGVYWAGTIDERSPKEESPAAEPYSALLTVGEFRRACQLVATLGHSISTLSPAPNSPYHPASQRLLSSLCPANGKNLAVRVSLSRVAQILGYEGVGMSRIYISPLHATCNAR